jgi:quinoprotein glucose dehydrogenase
MSRTIDRPGGRFMSGTIAVGLVIVLMAVLFWRWRQRAG